MDLESINNKLIFYDLKDEFKEQFKYGLSNVDKVAWYKAYNKENNKENTIDCDVCELTISVYKLAWEFLKKSEPSNQERNINGSQVTFKNKYQLMLDDEIYLGDSMTSFAHTKTQLKKIVYKKDTQKIKIEENIEELAKLYHTLGNMIPIPDKFNIERSGVYADCDFWDLTMQKIKEWYEKKGDKEAQRKTLEELLNPHKENRHVTTSVTNCENWLNHFKTWNEFVKQNFLNAFIAKKENGELIKDENDNYIPIVFWEGHSHNSVDIPTSEEEFLDYLVLLNTAIRDRNKDIINEIINL